jgi:hypothetical protein
VSAGPGVLIQANFKTAAGTLLNVYGQDEASFDIGLAILHDRLAQMTEIEQQLRGASAVAAVLPLAPVQPPSTDAGSGWSTTAPAPTMAPPSFTGAATPFGPDGRPRVAKSGAGAKGPWKAWFTAAKKGEPGWDEPIWVRAGTPEWSSFPA